MHAKATELTSVVPPWPLADYEGLTGIVVRTPTRDEIPAPVDEQRIVEYYSK